MALDYSKLSDDELEAIANDDYSKLSNSTLEAMASEGPKPNVGKTLGEKSWSEALAPAVGVGAAAYEIGKDVVKPVYDVAKSLVTNPLVDLAAAPFALKKAGEYLGTRTPAAPGALDAGGQKVVDWVKQGARTVAPEAASTLTSVSPAMMLGAPYALAGMEAANIRKNPNAPGYKDVPYAQQFRGEYGTQGQAAAANTRNALIGQQYGGLTPDEQAIMAEERQRQVKQAQARQVLKQPPTSQNFIERSKALADLYGGAR
jgi:hypothetical protein